MVGSDVKGDGKKFVPWPDWEVGDMPSLARYVSVAALDDISLPIVDRYTDPDPERGRGIAHRIYDSILALDLKYMHEPWRLERFGLREFADMQRVRYPAWIWRDSGGTCLDLAILYAAALMKAQIRPYIAILYPGELAESARGVPQGHAFVIADLQRPLTDQYWDRAVPGPLEKPASEEGEKGTLVIRAGQVLPRRFLAVDPTRATTNFPLGGGKTSTSTEGFAQTRAAASAYLVNTEAKVCDVATAQLEGFPALGRPADTATPAIWTRLPEMPQESDYPSRRTQRVNLTRARGRIVIYGPPGSGKSTLACLRARSADGGYGWFLNAADRSTLQAQLAQAENDQRARSYEQPLEKLDQAPFAELAVRRLEVSEAPWVLVLDNADGEPGDVIPMLPRNIGSGQTVIVTTTNPQWLKEWPEAAPETPAAHVLLKPLDSSDMPGIDESLRPLMDGSPLFYEAARMAISFGASIPQAPESAAGLAWQLARDYLSGNAAALDLAHLVAWGPPTALPVGDFADFFANDGMPDALADLAQPLAEAGLVRLLTQPVPSVLMHRLIAARIRADERLIQVPGHPQPVPAPVALMAASAGQNLMTRLGDAESFKRLEAELGSEPDSLVPKRTWALAVYGIARAGEIRGRSAQSSSLFEKAIGSLDQRLDLSLLSECWNGRARHMKDHPPADRAEHIPALNMALAWALTARELGTRAAENASEGSRQQLWDLIRAERAHAMQGLIMRKQANHFDDPAAQKRRRADAMAMLAESEDLRVAYLEQLGISDSPDMDRARFNLGGSGIGLAKLSRDAEAEGYLRDTLEAYERAKQIRVRRFGEGMALASVASCDHGIALAYYYSALLEADPRRDRGGEYRPVSAQTRMLLLRQASAACAQALRDRTLLAPADGDGDDALKSDELTIKVGQMRKLISSFHAKGRIPLGIAEAWKLIDIPEWAHLPGRKLPEVLEEARDLAGIIKDTVNGEPDTCLV
jgi:hypothetical protein